MRKIVENREFNHNGNVFYLVLKEIKNNSFSIVVLNAKGLAITNNSSQKKLIFKSLIKVVNFKKAFRFDCLIKARTSYTKLLNEINN